jgi:hypothetical protein
MIQPFPKITDLEKRLNNLRSKFAIDNEFRLDPYNILLLLVFVIRIGTCSKN